MALTMIVEVERARRWRLVLRRYQATKNAGQPADGWAAL
jgi:hypothetical protein